MEKVLIRTVTTEYVEAPITYPFYRKERINGHENYWQFANPRDAVLLVREGARTTIIQYDNCTSNYTPLTAALLDAMNGEVSKITKEEFERVRNAIVVDLLKPH